MLSDPLRAEYLNILVGQEDSVFTGSVSCQVTDADAGTVRRTLTLNGKKRGILYPSYSYLNSYTQSLCLVSYLNIAVLSFKIMQLCVQIDSVLLPT